MIAGAGFFDKLRPPVEDTGGFFSSEKVSKNFFNRVQPNPAVYGI